MVSSRHIFYSGEVVLQHKLGTLTSLKHQIINSTLQPTAASHLMCCVSQKTQSESFRRSLGGDVLLLLTAVTNHNLRLLTEVTNHNLLLLAAVTSHSLCLLSEVTNHNLCLLAEVTIHNLCLLAAVTNHIPCLLAAVTNHSPCLLAEVTNHSARVNEFLPTWLLARSSPA